MQLRLYRNTRLAEKHERNSTRYISHIAAIKDSAHSLRNIYERRQCINRFTRRFILDRIYYLPPSPPINYWPTKPLTKPLMNAV